MLGKQLSLPVPKGSVNNGRQEVSELLYIHEIIKEPVKTDSLLMNVVRTFHLWGSAMVQLLKSNTLVTFPMKYQLMHVHFVYQS